MPFIQASPVITSSGQVAPGVVETTDIADNAVTPDKLSHGNDGQVLLMTGGAPAWGTPAAVPTGSVIPYAGSSAPTDWLLADGSVVSQATYAALYAIIGHTYAADPGGGNFTLPNLKGKIPVGKNAAETEFDTLGETGGAKTHTLTEAEMPAHTHDEHVAGADNGTGYTAVLTSNPVAPGDQFATGSKGGGGAHNNLQPYITLNYIIKT